jgi:uncharacterized protein (TIGR02147 family)
MKMNKMTARKNIFAYDDYRAYLRDHYAQAKAANRDYSFRYFSRLAGFKSPNFLKVVMEGKSKLSRKSIGKFIKALKLSREEAVYFRNLVLLNQAATPSEREQFAEEILKLKAFRQSHPLAEAQFRYYSHWYFAALRELVGLAGFKEDPEWIAQKIKPAILPDQAREALAELQNLGLISRGPDGRLGLTAAHVTTADEVASNFVAKFHREMMKKAADSIDAIPRDRREISSLTMGMSEKTAKIIKEMIQNFRKQIVEILNRDEGSHAVYQLNFQLFPLADLNEKEGR